MKNDPFSSSDTDIVRQVLDGNVNAFESLLKRHRGLVEKIVRKHVPHNDIEETVQDAFVRAYLSLATFAGKSDFSQWLSAIALRTCYDFWRKAYRSREIPMSVITDKHRDWLEEVLSGESGEARREASLRSEAKELLEYALGTLSAEDRMVLELVYLEGLSVKEAANLLGWSTANVKVRSFRSRRKLEKLLRGMREQGGKAS
jgi:RNA polymerase sigma-70 factor (ECF subfamily)